MMFYNFNFKFLEKKIQKIAFIHLYSSVGGVILRKTLRHASICKELSIKFDPFKIKFVDFHI